MAIENGQQPMGRYSTHGIHDKRFIAQIVEQVLQGKPRQAVCQEYGINPHTLRNWLINNKLGTDLAKTRTGVPMQVKRTVVRALQSGRMTMQQVRQAYGIKSETTVHNWVRQLNQQNDELAQVNDTLMKKKKQQKPTPSGDQAALKALQQQLADAQLKIAALNTLIDVAEEQLKINIRKKPGAKQSGD